MRHFQHSILLLICLIALFTSFAASQTKIKSKLPVVKSQVKAINEKKSDKYPNELSDFRFYEEAKWSELNFLVSTMEDVRKVLGEPSEAKDVSQYTKPYPGDKKAKQPVFTYNLNSDWQILVYFVKYCFQGDVPLPNSLDNKLCSIDLIPRKRISFAAIIFPKTFEKKEIQAVDAAWIEYADGTGLSYQIYTVPGPYGRQKSGDLNRIVYTAPNETFKSYSTSKN